MNGRRPTVIHHLVAVAILRWVTFYTRNLPAEVAGERRDEIASDLYEQSMGVGPGAAARWRLALSLAWRATRGVAADLLWRNGRIRSQEARERTVSAEADLPRRYSSGAAVTLALAMSTAVVGLLCTVRILANPAARMAQETQLLLILAAAAMVTALALMARAATRPAALAVMAAASVPLMWAVGVSLWSVSATLGSFLMQLLGLMNLTPDKTGYVVVVPGVVLAGFFSVMALRASREKAPGGPR
jgi:hypothetical protein